MTARNAPPVAALPQRAGGGSARTAHARPVRFRLSVHSPRDQAITRWLEGIPLYARAEVIRCVLYDHVQGQAACLTAQPPSRPSPPSPSPLPSPSAADEDPAATKLRRMF